jgi:Uma2 family endonuclease
VARPAERSGFTPAEFLVWERDQQTRHEYFRGEAFAMAGGSPRHNVLCSRVNMALLGALDSKGCYVFSSDQKIALSGDRYVYPDLSAICGAIAIEAGTTDVITNPQVVVEVLSTSTEPYDRGLKWEGYQRIPSISDYVLVSQSEPRIEHFLRDVNGAWVYRAAGPGERIVLAGGAVLDVDAIFAGALDIAGE